MKTIFSSILILLVLGSQIFAQGTQLKPRIINMTDLGADPDDEQSMVRFLVQSNEYDVEGLIVTTGCWKKSQSNINMLNSLLNAYGQVVSNLQVHDPDFPSLEYLQSVSVLGQRGYGIRDVGSGKDSPGSELIISAVDEDDPRPVWITFWGGGNTLAQALWKVQNTRTPEELQEFISKIRVYDILGQDNAGTWIAKNFPDLIYIRAKQVYDWQPSDSWLDTHVQNHGALGAAYPDRKYATEGDTPAFMHLFPNGLNNPDEVWQGGWGGRFGRNKQSGIRGMSCMDGEDQYYDTYYMYGNASGNSDISKWSNGYHNDFQARMDWSITSDYSDANHHPIAVVNDDDTKQVLEINAAPGATVDLSAVGSSDPDGDSLIYKWSFYREAGTYLGRSVTIDNSTTDAPTVHVPSEVDSAEIHIILELSDSGIPSLYAYRRVIIKVHADNTDPRWVGTWSAAPYAAANNTPPSPFLANNTLRQVVRVSIGGDTLRVKFSNRTSSTPVTMNKVNIAVSTDRSTSVIDTSTMKELKFSGNESVTMDAYTEVTSDPIAFPLTPNMNLAITIYYGQCETASDMTFHYGSRTDSYILAGDQSTSADFAGATTVERWYNLSSIDVLATTKSAAVAVIGNSITDGYGIHDGDNKWTDTFSEKLLDNESTSHVSVLNLGIGATSVTTSGVSRFQQDVLAQSGLRWSIVFYGVNDIGANKPADDVITAFKTLISQAHAQNIRIYGATITPFKGHSYYTASREAVRVEVNEWIRTPGNFDKCIDFDKAIRDPADTEKLHADYSNDWLHPNAAGYQLLGESVDLNLFLGADTLYEQPDTSGIESHYFESECGSVGNNWNIIEDANASNGRYISVKPEIESLDSAATGSDNIIEFPFTITNDSTYFLYARLNCPTADDDSYWVKMDDGDFVMYNNLGTSGWQWLQLQSYDLIAGDHTLTITYREDGASLDKLCISNYFEVPVGMGEEAENLCDLTDVENKSEIPHRFGLEQNYPNPFNPTTSIKYQVANSKKVSLKVYDVLGNEIATLVNEEKSPGYYTIKFDASNCSSGVYFYQLITEGFIETKKMLLIK